MGVASSVKIDSWSAAHRSVLSCLAADGSVPRVTDTPWRTTSRRPSASATCSSTTTSARPSRSTGPAATGGARARSCAPPTPQRWPRVIGRLPRARRAPSCPRAATPAWSARASRAAARWSSARRGCTELGAVDRAAAQVDGRRRRHARARCRSSARGAGLDAGVDFAARDSATVGGLVATNAGGMRALRYGTVRARVAGLQAVLADGSIIDRPTAAQGQRRLRPARRCWSAARARSAIITARALAAGAAAAQPRGRADRPADSLDQAADLLADVRPRLPSLDAAEFFLDEGLQLVLDHLGAPGAGARRARRSYVLLECAALADPTDELAAGAWRDAGDRGRRRGRRQRRARAAVALSRGAHRGDLAPRASRTSWTSAFRSRGWPSSPSACAAEVGAPGSGRARDPLRPPRRRQRPRQRARPRARGRRVDEAVLRAGRRTAAARSAPSTASAWPRRAGSSSCARRASCARCAPIKRALDPDGLLNPGVMLP